jgi:hypothetical protein
MEIANEKLESALNETPEKFCISKVTQLKLDVSTTTEVYDIMLSTFKEEFPNVKPFDI